MTTSHTMGLAPPSPDWAADYTARFGFAISPFTGTVIEGTQHEIARNDWLVSYSPVRDLDVALIRLAEKVGETETDGTQRGWVDLCEANHQPLPGTAVAIMQHPEGGPLKIAMSTDAVIRLDPNLQRLFYRTDTLPGASGAPCFDIDWRFLAMHRGHSFEHGNYNEGIPIAAIADWLQKIGLWDLVSIKPPGFPNPHIAESGVPAESSFGIGADLKRAIFHEGEGQRLEFKVRATEIPEEGAKARPAARLLNSVAAFMNSRQGGTVLIGISNNSEFVGIETEYEIVDRQKKNWDGYALWLHNVLASRLDAAAAFDYYSILRYREQGKDICAIHVQPAETPVFLGKDFYVRVGNRNEPQTAHDLLAYVASRWSWLGSRLQEKKGPSAGTAGEG